LTQEDLIVAMSEQLRRKGLNFHPGDLERFVAGIPSHLRVVSTPSDWADLFRSAYDSFSTGPMAYNARTRAPLVSGVILLVVGAFLLFLPTILGEPVDFGGHRSGRVFDVTLMFMRIGTVGSSIPLTAGYILTFVAIRRLLDARKKSWREGWPAGLLLAGAGATVACIGFAIFNVIAIFYYQPFVDVISALSSLVLILAGSSLFAVGIAVATIAGACQLRENWRRNRR
jgi:hypothetical protein